MLYTISRQELSVGGSEHGMVGYEAREARKKQSINVEVILFL